MASSVEDPIIFQCDGAHLLGILHRPSEPRSRAVLIVVGGPQYRVGSHRQFLLLARSLAERGTAVLRFDYRGMGDSEGNAISFEEVSIDIRAAVDVIFNRVKEVSDVVIWGLCDAASAAMMYAFQDARVSGLVLANPWARTEATIAKTYLQHYYKSRLLNPVLWKRIFSGKVKVWRRITEFFVTLRRSVARSTGTPANQIDQSEDSAPYTERMRLGLQRFTGRVLFIISGDDLTAAEFTGMVKASTQWQQLLERGNTERRKLDEANHTFSRREWCDQVAVMTDEWLQSW